MIMDYAQLWNIAEAHRSSLLGFAQKLIQTPSLPGEEGPIGAVIQAEMERLGYDGVWRDEAGNVVGRIVGGEGPSTMLNGHMDHVDAGDPGRWHYPPFGGEIHGDELWGRGAADMKGALAAMVYAGGLVKRLDWPVPGDLYVSGVVQEEVGGLGSRHLARTLPIAQVIVGEASGNNLRRGHRGRLELHADFEGRSAHASMPDLSINPHYSMARFISSLRALEMVADPHYGASTVAPTRTETEPRGANITPASLHLVLDWRNVPGESQAEVVAKLEALMARSLEPGCTGQVTLAAKELVSYTGFRESYADAFPSFTTAADHPWLAVLQPKLSSALGRQVEIGTWRFATDGGHFAAAGKTVLGFGPGDEGLVHTVEERLPINQLVESMVGYMAIILV
jgi:succinyl-diaminopimelate desuccinylase